MANFADAKEYLRPTLEDPDTVWEMQEDGYLYCRNFGHKTKDFRHLYIVRVRKTGWRAYVWAFERHSDVDPLAPKAQDGDRILQRVK